MRPSLTAKDGLAFLHFCMPRRFNGKVTLIQTDGGSEFEAEFVQAVSGFCDTHHIARPYKKNEQAHIESFNRSVRKECLEGVFRLGQIQARPDTPLDRRRGSISGTVSLPPHHRPHLAFEPMRPTLTR